MLKVVLLAVLVLPLYSFIVDNKNYTFGQNGGGNQCLTAYDKMLIDNDIAKVRKDQKDILNMLNEQLQQRFMEMEKQIEKKASKNGTCDALLNNLETKYRELEQNNSDLINVGETLQNNLNELNKELSRLKNKTSNLEIQLKNIRQLENIDHLQTLTGMNKKLQTLDTSVAILMSQNQAKSQDFLALYNITIDTKTALQYYEKKISDDMISQNASLKKTEAAVKNEIMNLEQLHNTTFADLQHQIIENNNQVVLSACDEENKDHPSGAVLKFHHIKTSTGNVNLPYFKSTGKFNCSTAGIYYISGTIVSHIFDARAYIFKNQVKIASLYVSSNKDWIFFSGSTSVAVHMDVGDAIYIQTGIAMHVNDVYSCITLMKI